VWDNAATLNVEVDVHPASAGDFCSSALDLTAETLPYTWDGELNDYTDGFVGLAANGCDETTGSEVWFTVSVPDGYWLSAENDSTTPVLIHVLESCLTNQCVASSANSVFWHNDTGDPVTMVVTVEGDGETAGPLSVTFETNEAPPCDPALEVEYLGKCYYLDGCGGICDPGYVLGPQEVLYTIASWFEGKNYKHTVSSNCCIYNSEEDQDFGMSDHCNSPGPFTATDVTPGGAGCSDIFPPILTANQLTLCMTE
jgi:hypothetical protein